MLQNLEILIYQCLKRCIRTNLVPSLAVIWAENET